jgi:hypothetical protein
MWTGGMRGTIAGGASRRFTGTTGLWRSHGASYHRSWLLGLFGDVEVAR